MKAVRFLSPKSSWANVFRAGLLALVLAWAPQTLTSPLCVELLWKQGLLQKLPQGPPQAFPHHLLSCPSGSRTRFHSAFLDISVFLGSGAQGIVRGQEIKPKIESQLLPLLKKPGEASTQ